MKRRNLESPIQRAIIQRLELEFRRVPGFDVRHIPNGGKRDARTAAILKRDGVKAGTPDLYVMGNPWGAGWLEVKAEKGRPTAEQKAFALNCEAAGVWYALVRDQDEAVAAIKFWASKGRP